MKIRSLFWVLGISVMYTSCSIKKKVSTQQVKDTKWTLVSHSNTPVNVSERNSSIHFKPNGELRAVAVCNTISGKYSADSKNMKLHMSDLTISYIGCHNLKKEAILLEALKAANKYLVHADSLFLLRDDEKLATFIRKELP